MRTAALFATAAMALAMPLAAQTADPLTEVEAQEERTGRVAEQLWNWAELGYLETRSSALLQDELESEGFRVEAGIADIPTAFMAEWG